MWHSERTYAHRREHGSKCNSNRFACVSGYLQHLRHARGLVRLGPHSTLPGRGACPIPDAGPHGDHPHGRRRGDRKPLQRRGDGLGQDEGPDAARRIPCAARRRTTYRALQGRFRAVVPLGCDDAGHHGHGHCAADSLRLGARAPGLASDRRFPPRARKQVPRHSHGGSQQSATGDPLDLRL